LRRTCVLEYSNNAQNFITSPMCSDGNTMLLLLQVIILICSMYICGELNFTLVCYALTARAILCVVSTLWRHVHVCEWCLQPGDTCRSVYYVCSLMNFAGLCSVSTLLRHVQVCELCMQSGHTFWSVYCVCSRTNFAGLCFMSTLLRHVQVCKWCLHSGDTCRSVNGFYTLATRAGL